MNIDELLRRELTPQQHAAATDPTAEILCLACAGSGKSRALAYRIARLLAEGAPPESIVAFTFTEKAADSIKRRVSEALLTVGLDPTVIGLMYIGTIHAFCQYVLGEMDVTYRQYDVLDDNRLKLFLISRYPQLGLHRFRSRARGNGYFNTIGEACDAWKTANDELLDYGDIGTEDPELAELLVAIRDRLQQDQYVDFSLMIRNVVEALQRGHPGLVPVISKIRHLMVDEYQDVNPSQEELIRLLHDRINTLFVVGDDDQSIYGWRGADVSNILGFHQRHPSCAIHTLSSNFRSTTPIVEATDRFVATQLGPSRHLKNPSAAADRTPQDFRVLWFLDRPGEAEWVASRIEALLGTAYDDEGLLRGLTPADFAILLRSTRMPEQDGRARHAAFTEVLERRQIPFTLAAGGGPFERPQIAALRSTFEILRNGSPDRPTLTAHYQAEVLPAYPQADFNALVRVLADWGRRIHRPRGSTRIRLYPQELVYDLLEAFSVAESGFDDDVMRDIGLFSHMILDVETVYMSVDSPRRFSEVLNFLQNAAETGYDVSTDDVVQRPDAVTVSTVHRMKGLEFPCVFVADVEAQRFPKKRAQYRGWLPAGVMAPAISRGAYQSTAEEEARLFYTAATRAERYLYVTGAENLPGGAKQRKASPYALSLSQHPAVEIDPTALPAGLVQASPRRRVEDADYPTSFSEIRSYLQCPKSYQFRERYGLCPAVPEMFGFGRTVHTSIQQLHILHSSAAPSESEVEAIVSANFHLKHVPESGDPVNRPGAYENARSRAVEMAKDYVFSFAQDFARERQVEVAFEIPARDCLISGSIDLLVREDTAGELLGAEIIDFKTMEGGADPIQNADLDWTELALQVQLYARAADQLLGENAKTGSVHLLKDNQRVDVPITDEALDAALENIEWAVAGILAGEFPMRPHPEKCSKCDFASLCPQQAQPFHSTSTLPPPLHLPGGENVRAQAFSLYELPANSADDGR